MTPTAESWKTESWKTESWKVVASSVVGVGHLRSGLPCQDAHAYRILEDGLLVIAVADGAGSAAKADVGAQLAVELAVGQIIADWNEGDRSKIRTGLRNASSDEPGEAVRRLSVEAIVFVRRSLELIAGQDEIALREYATTLILVVATANWLSAVQIGDGAVVGRDVEGAVFAVTTPPEAEYANSTTFITSPEWQKEIQWSYREGAIAGLAVFSDGLQRLALKLPEGTPHPPFFSPLFRFVSGLAVADGNVDPVGTSQLTSFLQSPRITERADDDLTLVLAVRG